jgi:hypothetical protein
LTTTAKTAPPSTADNTDSKNNAYAKAASTWATTDQSTQPKTEVTIPTKVDTTSSRAEISLLKMVSTAETINVTTNGVKFDASSPNSRTTPQTLYAASQQPAVDLTSRITVTTSQQTEMTTQKISSDMFSTTSPPRAFPVSSLADVKTQNVDNNSTSTILTEVSCR